MGQRISTICKQIASDIENRGVEGALAGFPSVAIDLAHLPTQIMLFFQKLLSRAPDLPRVVRGPTVKSQQAMREEAREKLGMDMEHHFNFAFVGESGGGKSSLINALREIKDDDPDAAPVGEVETTTNIKAYAHSKYRHIMFWDLPGAGTPDHPESTYFEDKMLYAFDTILVVSCSRFKEIDYKIASLAWEYQTSIVFVRTKADQDIQAKVKRDTTRSFTMEEHGEKLKKEVLQSFQAGLTKAAPNIVCSLYIVSAWAFDEKNGAYGVDESFKGLDEHLLLCSLIKSVRSRLSP